MKKLNPHEFDPSIIDRKQLGKISDGDIARQLDINPDIVCYWRNKWGIPSLKKNIENERQFMFNDGYHWCSKCQDYKSIDEFNKNNRNRFGLKTHCNGCRKSYRDENSEEINRRKRKSYEDNRDEIRASQSEYRERNRDEILKQMRKRHARQKSWANALFGNICARCGYGEFQSGLEFHHVNPDEKDESPNMAINSGDKKRIRYELDKCIMLCRNCHMTFHAGEWDATFEKRTDIGWKITKFLL